MKRLWKQKNNGSPRRRRLDAEQIAERKQSEQYGQRLFRRNRTLVGSLSSEVRSASERSGGLHSPRTHVHRLTAHRRLLASIFVVVIAAACLLTWLLYEFTADVAVSATDSPPIDATRYQKIINNYLDSHPIERLRFALNDSGLTQYLSQAAPEVASVQANGAAGFATSQFDLTFRHPVASWLINSTQYYVDQNGVPFELNYYDKPSVKIIDQSGIPETAGIAVASSRFLGFVGRAVTLAQADKLVIRQAIIPASTTHQIEVILAGHKYPVKLSLDRPVAGQVEDMANAIKYFDTHHIHPAYIDVRVSGEAYYK